MRCLPMDLFEPILPSPRYLKNIEITSDNNGFPLLTRSLFLLDTKIPECEIKKRFPTLFKYLQEGKATGICDRYICCHRSPWYAQENRPPAPIICTYLGRGDSKNGRPFRFILNNSAATVANVYLAMYPTSSLMEHLKKDPSLIRSIWEELNQLSPDKLIGEGRVYGGGLHKLEPKELANVDATSILSLIPNFKLSNITNHQNSLPLNIRKTCDIRTGISVSG